MSGFTETSLISRTGLRNHYPTHSDSELIELLCKSSDETAFAEIYARYGKEMVSEAHRKTGEKAAAEDIVQEVFVQLWLKRGRIVIDKNIRAYLKGMLKYHIIDHYSSRKSSPIVPAASIPLLPDPLENDYISSHFLRSYYEEALTKLPDKCREVFELSRSGRSIKEIASELGISEKTVEVHIGKALRLLRLEMKDYLAPFLLFFCFLE